MRHFKSGRSGILAVAIWLIFCQSFAGTNAASNPSSWTLEQKEAFLKKGDIIAEKPLSVGVTHSLRVTLEYNGVQHHAHVQTIDIKRRSVQTAKGTEVNFRDFYGFNIAAYELDKLLGLNMTPSSVERRYKGERAAFTWWVDDVAMMEKDRVEKNLQPPDPEYWKKQMCIVQIINQLIYDTDPNQGNLLITKDWKIWTIDRTRAFRPYKNLENPDLLNYCERALFARLKDLNRDTLKRKLKDFLTGMEIDSLDARRELIVKHFETRIAGQSEAAVLFDLSPNK